MKKIIFVLIFTSVNTFGQNDSTSSFLKGIDIGVSITPSIYQKHKIYKSYGKNYILFKNRVSLDFGISTSISFFKGKVSLNTGLEVGFVPIDELYYIPKEDILLEGSQEPYETQGQRPVWYAQFLKIPLHVQNNFSFLNKNCFILGGVNVRYFHDASVGTWKALEFEDTRQGFIGQKIYHEGFLVK